MKRNIKKIMLISPPVTRPKDFSAEVVRVSVFFPLGLAYLSAVLEGTGKYELRILDALIERDVKRPVFLNGGDSIRYGMTDQDLTESIGGFLPDVVCVSCLFAATQWDAANVCRMAKKVDERIVTMVGGAHAGANAETFLENYPKIDFVVIGEGEDTLIRLLEVLKAAGSPSLLNGISFREGKSIHLIPKTEYIECLDVIPFPARHLFDMTKYFSKAMAHSVYRKTPFTPIISSRGCPCKCAFCALENHWGKRHRRRSAENVLDEIEHLINEYGVQEIHFEDDNLTAHKKRALKIFDGMIERGFNISWNVPSGMAVYTLDDEILEKMRASGCYSVSIAIENGSPWVLRELMNKPVDLPKVPKLVQKIRELGMDARGFFILGYPDETRETIRQTIDFARAIELDWAYFFIASALPHTKMWETCIKKGYIKKKDFDPIRSFHKSIIRTPEFTPDYLEKVREEAIVDINFRNNPNLRKYDVNKAIESFKDVTAKYPHFDFAHFYLGEAYSKKEDKKNALKAYKAALEANPSHEEAKHRLAKLEHS